MCCVARPFYGNGESLSTVNVALVSEVRSKVAAPVDKKAKSTCPLRNSMILPCKMVVSVVESGLNCREESMKLPFCRTPAEMVWPGAATGAMRII